jgi:hypothetical protein
MMGQVAMIDFRLYVKCWGMIPVNHAPLLGAGLFLYVDSKIVPPAYSLVLGYCGIYNGSNNEKVIGEFTKTTI